MPALEAAIKPKNRVRQLRLAQGMSVEQVAQKAGVARSVAYYADAPWSTPGLCTAAKLARALGVGLDELVCE